MFRGDPNDPNGDVQKALGCGCVLAILIVAVIVMAIWRVI